PCESDRKASTPAELPPDFQVVPGTRQADPDLVPRSGAWYSLARCVRRRAVMMKRAKKRAVKAPEEWSYCATRKRSMQPGRTRSLSLSTSSRTTPFSVPRSQWFFAGLVWTVAGVLGLGLLVGCSPRRVPTGAVAKRFQGVVLTVACPGEPAVS